MNEVLWHYVERAVQCADARIDGRDKVHTDPFFFSIPDRHTKKSKKTPKQQLALGCCKNCLHCQESTIDSRNESASSQFAVPDSFKHKAPMLLLVPRVRILQYSSTYAINTVRHRYDSQVSGFFCLTSARASILAVLKCLWSVM